MYACVYLFMYGTYVCTVGRYIILAGYYVISSFQPMRSSTGGSSNGQIESLSSNPYVCVIEINNADSILPFSLDLAEFYKYVCLCACTLVRMYVYEY